MGDGMNQIFKPMRVTSDNAEPHITDPTLAGKKYSIYSTPYNRSVSELAVFVIKTHELVQHLKLNRNDDLYKMRYYYIACRGVEIWPWIRSDNMVDVILRVNEQVLRYYSTPWRRILKAFKRVAKRVMG